ncbi:STY0301 family protein [Massilia sp. DWR3-1-1]|uniref:STY0301 family protein n=1 Tax=Massilia sp. DWR3-1-1 TaxID=2804559 RepID=UPI003CE7C714
MGNASIPLTMPMCFPSSNHPRTRKLILLARASFTVTAGLTPDASAGNRSPIVCPTELPASSILVRSVPAGWTAQRRPVPIRALRQSPSRRGPAGQVHHYKFAAPFVNGKWIECHYGALNELTLSPRLPDNTAQWQCCEGTIFAIVRCLTSDILHATMQPYSPTNVQAE